MRLTVLRRRPRVCGPALAALVALLAPPPVVASPPDPVEDLREALASSPPPGAPQDAALARRAEKVKRGLAALKTVGELRQALALHAWRDLPHQGGAIPSDQPARAEVGRRLQKALTEAARKGDAAGRLAVAHLIGALGVDIRGTEPGSVRGFGSTLAPLLIRLCGDPEPAVRAAAAGALGRVHPEPKAAAAALKRVLEKDEAGPRRAAAAALGRLVEVASALQRTGRTQTGVEASSTDVFEASTEAVVAVGPGLKDADPQVRAFCLGAVARAAGALREQIPDPFLPGEFPPPGAGLTEQERQNLDRAARQLAAEQALFRPVVSALKEHGPALRQSLRAPEAAVNQRAAEALELLAELRTRLRRRAASGPPAPKGGGAKKGEDDPLAAVLLFPVPDLAGRLTHDNVRVRLACLYALEALGTDATPAAEALIKALKDKNAFVRWGAARALGRIEPAAAGKGVATRATLGLAGCLEDQSADVRTTALLALRRYGPAAAPAVDSLAKTLKSGDAGTRLLVIQTLEAVGPTAKPAALALAGVLSAEEAQVRAAAARALGRLGGAAGAARKALVAALEDADPSVRLAASEALLSVKPAGK
jgi:HEAT repeat protein